jgi:hypothetical protein
MTKTDDVDALTQKRASDVLRDTDRDSVGVVRILRDGAGPPGDEREYQPGDEALVETGAAEWVVAPVHLPSAGRRLDGAPGAAQTSATPLDGVEVYPPAEPTTFARRSEARKEGSVEAHTSDVDEALVKVRKDNAPASPDGDAKTQAALGGRSARSGPVTRGSDILPDVEEAPAAEPGTGKTEDSATGRKR